MFGFTIRDVLWLRVVVAMALGWWADRTSLHRQMQRKTDEQMRRDVTDIGLR